MVLAAPASRHLEMTHSPVSDDDLELAFSNTHTPTSSSSSDTEVFLGRKQRLGGPMFHARGDEDDKLAASLTKTGTAPSTFKLAQVDRHLSEETLYDDEEDNSAAATADWLSSPISAPSPAFEQWEGSFVTYDELSKLTARAGPLSPLSMHLDRFSGELLLRCIEAMTLCYYGYCQHADCVACLKRVPTPDERRQFRTKVDQSLGSLAAYLSRLLSAVPINAITLERAISYLQRLRRNLEQKPIDDPDARASKTWGAHHLVFVTACMIACKYGNDDAVGILFLGSEN